MGLALDLTLRAEGRGTLDDVMRGLWARSGGGPVSEADIAAVLHDVSGRSMARELAEWVHGTDDLPLQKLLARFGVSWSAQAPTLAQRLGLRVSESPLTGVKVTSVLRGGEGEAAGLSAGDELIAVDGWRVRRLDDAARVLPASGEVELLTVRDGRVRHLAAIVPAAPDAGAVTLAPESAKGLVAGALELRRAWLPG